MFVCLVICLGDSNIIEASKDIIRVGHSSKIYYFCWLLERSMGSMESKR